MNTAELDTASRPAVTGRLGLRTLDTVPAGYRPAVRPDRLDVGIVHLGLGAFFRAHQAVYTEDAIAAAGGDWGICAVAPRSRDVLERLAEQDGLYSVLSLDGTAGSRPRVVGVLAELRRAAADPLAVVNRLADPKVRVVTLTVTEKAYGLDRSTGRLRIDERLGAELRGERPPTSLPGLVVRGLLARARADAGPIAVVSCDNLPSNGRLLGDVVRRGVAFAGQRGAPEWLAANVTFPATMVDRIVPASTAETLAAARAALGVADLAAVAAEPFRQWVIEDAFPAGRPAWELVGATLAADVEPWERMKLRVLNGLHSTLAYLGALAGVETIAEALELPGMRQFLARMVAEDIAPTLEAIDGQPAEGYADTVLERFSNAALGHRTLQVAMDGTQKLPQRLLGTVADRRRAGAEPGAAALALAAWMRFARGYGDDGGSLPLDDPLADRLREAVAGAPDTAAGLADALFACGAGAGVFSEELAADDRLRTLVTGWLRVLAEGGVPAALAHAT